MKPQDWPFSTPQGPSFSVSDTPTRQIAAKQPNVPVSFDTEVATTCKTPPHANSATGENKTKTEAGPMRKIWAVSWVTIWSGMSSSKKLYELCDNTGTPSVLFAIIQVRFIDRANRCTLSTVFQKFVRVLTFVHSHSKRDNNFRFELIASLQLSRASSFLC